MSMFCNKFNADEETWLPGTGGKAKPFTVLRESNGLRCKTEKFEIFFSCKHIDKTIKKMRSYLLSEGVDSVRIGAQAIIFKKLAHPDDSIEGFVRICGPKNKIDVMQGNLFAALLTEAGLGAVKKNKKLKGNPKAFFPAEKFFQLNPLEYQHPKEKKIRSTWARKKETAKKYSLKGRMFDSYNSFKKWYLQQYETLPHCYYCGIPEPLIKVVYWDIRKTKRPKTRLKLEVDRIDPALNYNEKNCVLACMACNNAKSDIFTKEEFEKIGKQIEEVWRSEISSLGESINVNDE